MSVLPRRSPFRGSLITGGSEDIYAPLLDGLTQYVQLSEVISIPSGVDFEISVVTSGIPSVAQYSIMSGPSIADFYRTRTDNDGIQTSLAGTYGLNWTGANSDTLLKHKYALKRVGDDISIVVDEIERSTRNTNIGTLAIDRLMRSWTSSIYTSGVVYSLEVSIGGVIATSIAFNQRNASVQLPTVGTISATIVNHTNAMWVKV
jgi:hypothetical protein